MRTLIYVAIIHTSADLGSIAKDVTKRGIADLGEDIWKEHKRTVDGFWDAISHHFDAIDVSGMKIYQDGMVAEGEVGQKIVEEIAKTGSKNYELVSSLLKRGAFLVKTEDFNLVKQEREKLLAIIKAKSVTEKLTAVIGYKLIKDRLLNKRDSFIAKRIDETLDHGERGVIFVGAFHNIKKKLPKSIQIKEIKNAEKVKEYQKLLPFHMRNRKRFQELAEYLIAEVGQDEIIGMKE